jgi:hypothetical protein
MKKINFLLTVLFISTLSLHHLSAQDGGFNFEVPPPQPEPAPIEQAPTPPVPAPETPEKTEIPPVQEVAPQVEKPEIKPEPAKVVKVTKQTKSEVSTLPDEKPTYTFNFADKRKITIDIYPIAGFPKPWSQVVGLLPSHLLYFNRDKSQRKMESQLLSMALRRVKELYADQQGYFEQKINQSLGERRTNEEDRESLMAKVAAHDPSVPNYILESYDRMKAFEILIHSINVRTRQP